MGSSTSISPETGLRINFLAQPDQPFQSPVVRQKHYSKHRTDRYCSPSLEEPKKCTTPFCLGTSQSDQDGTQQCFLFRGLHINIFPENYAFHVLLTPCVRVQRIRGGACSSYRRAHPLPDQQPGLLREADDAAVKKVISDVSSL